MRRFRFIGKESQYNHFGRKPFFINGNIYSENQIGVDCLFPVSKYVVEFPEDWKEVFDESKQLHKDTDLGYFAGLMVANGYMIDDALIRAKELIKQLDKEINP